MHAWLRMVGLDIRALARSRAWWALMLAGPLAVVAMLAMLASQLDQVAEAQCARPAVIATAFVPPELHQQVSESRHNAAGAEATISQIDGADAVLVRACLAALAAAEDADREHDDATIDDANKTTPPTAEQRVRWRHDALTVLHRHHVAAMVVGLSVPSARPFRLAVALDDANPQADNLRSDITAGLDAWHDATVNARLEHLHIDPAVRHVLDDRVITVSAPADTVARTWDGRLVIGLGLLIFLGLLPLTTLTSAPLSSALLATGGWSARWLTGTIAAVLLGGLWLTAGLLLVGLGSAPWFGPDGDHEALAVLLSGWWPGAALPALALLGGGAVMRLRTVADTWRGPVVALTGLAAVLLVGMAGITGLRPHALVDVVPVVGPLVAMKAACAGATPWRDLIIATAAHAFYGAILAWWSARARLTWSPTWEAVTLYAAAVAVFTSVSPLFADESDPVALCAPLALGVLGIAVVHALVRRPALCTAWSLRLPTWHWWPITVWAAPALALVGMAVGDLQPDLPSGMATGAETLDQISTAHWTLALACLALVPALCEELLFRGAILGLLRQRLPAVAAVLMSALMFAALHGSPWRFLPQFAVGIVLATLTLRSGSVLPAILLHAAYNGLLWALDMWRSDLEHLPVLRHIVAWSPSTMLWVGSLGVLAAFFVTQRKTTRNETHVTDRVPNAPTDISDRGKSPLDATA